MTKQAGHENPSGNESEGNTMKSSIKQLQVALRSAQADGFLITSPVNRRYLTGFNSTDGWLLITERGAELLVDSRYIEAAQQEAKDCEVRQFSRIYETLRERLAAHRVKNLMIEQRETTLAAWEMLRKQLPETTLMNAPALDDAIDGMRSIKTSSDLAALKRAQTITEEAFEHILGYLRPGMTEREVALELEFFMRRRGAERVSFDLIVVTGEKSSMPHGVPGDKIIAPGDFVTMDTGAVVDGMHSDMTRTVAIGSVSDEQRKVYNIVRQAQEAAIAKVCAGVSCKAVDDAARDVITQAGYGSYFGHSTGHSVGFEIHESPNFSPSSTAIAAENMVLTVEPGIYLPGRFGVRIEDMVRVTKNGCENLTHANKDLIIL